MAYLALAQGIFRNTARSTRGRNFSDIAQTLDSQADNLQRVAEAANQDGVEDALLGFMGGIRNMVDGVFDSKRRGGNSEIRGSAEHLKKTAADLRLVAIGTDMKNMEHDGQTLAQAQLGRSGSETADLEKMAGENTVLDKTAAVGAGAHETEHTRQANQSVNVVSKDGSAHDALVSNTLDDAPEPGEVTSTQLEEAGAIVEQKKAAPGSFARLTQRYKDTYKHVLSYVPESRIVELARRPDGLERLQREAMSAR